MLALTLDAAKNIAIAVAVIFIVGAIASMWLMKTIVQKLAVVAVLGLLAFAVWSQRTALQDCADKVQENFELAGPRSSSPTRRARSSASRSRSPTRETAEPDEQRTSSQMGSPQDGAVRPTSRRRPASTAERSPG